MEVLQQQLHWFGQSYALRTDMRVASGLEDRFLSPVVEAHLLRIVQAALTNVCKHAHATSVQVELALADDDTQVCVIIADDGAGFDPAQYALSASRNDPSMHYGLESMRSRAAEVGARCRSAAPPARAPG